MGLLVGIRWLDCREGVLVALSTELIHNSKQKAFYCKNRHLMRLNSCSIRSFVSNEHLICDFKGTVGGSRKEKRVASQSHPGAFALNGQSDCSHDRPFCGQNSSVKVNCDSAKDITKQKQCASIITKESYKKYSKDSRIKITRLFSHSTCPSIPANARCSILEVSCFLLAGQRERDEWGGRIDPPLDGVMDGWMMDHQWCVCLSSCASECPHDWLSEGGSGPQKVSQSKHTRHEH